MYSRLPSEIPGYSVPEHVARGNGSLILRATRTSDGAPVILKTPLPGHERLSESVRIYHEYELLRLLDAPGIIRALSLETRAGVPTLVLEDFGGIGLDAYLRSHRLDVSSALRIALQIAHALDAIHSHRIVHKDINPSNIVINPVTEQAKVIDFGIASQIPREMAAPTGALVLEGTLEYLSPEQTGRVNRVIDYRADYYALGVTLYQLLIGWLPFQSTDPLELVHSHIARAPAAPAELNPGIPQAVSAVVMKLLAKNADERYQTAFGLESDLEDCLRHLGSPGALGEFTPGRNDISEHFQVPQRLFGRDAAVRSLHEAFERSCQERPVLLLVQGPAGIGKSVFVRELQEPILRRRGLFVSGKFDQFCHDTPYAPFAHAFRELIDHLLALSEPELERVREALRDALGSLASVLCAVIPETVVILGEQPAPEELPAAESENRFKSAILRFVETIAGRDRPLVVFIDDVQWADSGSAALLELLLSEAHTEGFMVIAALRTDELATTHPVNQVFASLQARKVPMVTLELGGLREPDVLALVAETLRCPAEQASELALLVASKTDGNPYFLLEFLKSLHEEGLLRFDRSSRQWVWDTKEIRNRGITDNVVSLVAGKIDKLPDETRRGLHIAACIGNQFDLRTYASVTRQAHKVAADSLWPAVQEGLIFPIGDSYKFVRDGGDRSDGGAYVPPANFLGVSYRFAHDRVQQAAYLREPEEERAETHHAIARALLGDGVDIDRGQRLFDVAGQYSLCAGTIRNERERRDVLRLHLLAGKRAKASSAYAASLNYVTQGLALIREDDWTTEYDLCRDLTLEHGECLYLLGRFGEAETVFDECLKRFSSIADRARVFSLKIDQDSHTGNIDKALSTGVEALRELGVRISRHPSRLTLLWEMVIARLRVRTRTIDDLLDLPAMTEERPRLAITLLMRLFGIAYSESEEFSALVVSKMLNLTLRFGNADVSSYAYGIYGLLLRAGFGAHRSAYQFGLLGVRLSDKFNNGLLRGRCNFVMGTLHNHWVNHARTNAESITLAYRLGYENGDLLYASYALSQKVMNLLVTGSPLPELEEESTSCLDFVRSIHHDDIAHYFVGPIRFVRNLTGNTASPSSFSDGTFDESAYRDSLEATRYTPPRMYYRFLKLQALCLRGRYDEAVTLAAESEPVRHALIGQVAEWEYDFFLALALARASRPSNAGRRTLHRLERTLSRWAALCPSNLECRHALVRAELDRREGRNESALMWYDRAIRVAREQGFRHVDALANEFAGRFHLEHGRQRIAADYLSSAVDAFRDWGATARVKELEKEFATLLPAPADPVGAHKSGSSFSTVTGASVFSLDLLSVLKASQTLSSEILLPRLLDRMLTIVIENAGAERAVFIAEHNGVLRVEAERDVRAKQSRVQMAEPLENSALACESVVRFVARTRQDVVMQDAVHDGRFAPDPYLTAKEPKSVLCMTVLHQGKLAGILYLENNLFVGAFTPDRVEVLRLLSTQIAVSMENARFHEQGRELARMQEELRLASRIQKELLPQAAPEIPGYTISGRNIPALAVGGDYFDFIRMDENRLAICVGDVSGKGLPASLLMANLQATLRGQTLLRSSPSETLRRANQLLHASTSPEKYATLFYGILDISVHRLHYCNAGHEFPLLLRADGSGIQLEQGGVGLGMLEDFPFEEETVEFGRGDLLVMYTDGVTEAMNRRDEQFGRDRLTVLVRESRNHSAASTVRTILEAVSDYRKETPQSDDITLVAVERS